MITSSESHMILAPVKLEQHHEHSYFSSEKREAHREVKFFIMFSLTLFLLVLRMQEGDLIFKFDKLFLQSRNLIWYPEVTSVYK